MQPASDLQTAQAPNLTNPILNTYLTHQLLFPSSLFFISFLFDCYFSLFLSFLSLFVFPLSFIVFHMLFYSPPLLLEIGEPNSFRIG